VPPLSLFLSITYSILRNRHARYILLRDNGQHESLERIRCLS
jgi:hypothetical protein